MDFDILKCKNGKLISFLYPNFKFVNVNIWI